MEHSSRAGGDDVRAKLANMLRRWADRVEGVRYEPVQVAFPRTGYVTVKRSPYRPVDYFGIVPLNITDGSMHGYMPYGRNDDWSEMLRDAAAY
jgi:hypothetical protein